MPAQELAKQRRIAIVISIGPAARINDPASRNWQAFWEELRRSGDVEGQNLTVERYSGEGRPERLADLAREVVGRNPDLILAIGPLITLAVSAVTSTIPIVATGTHPSSGVVPSLARPGGNMTGARVELGYEIWGKRLQILKELALRRLIDRQQREALAAMFGSGFASSSDGQFFRAGGFGRDASSINAHYGDEPGAVAAVLAAKPGRRNRLAPVAQRIEQLTSDQPVGSSRSIPLRS